MRIRLWRYGWRLAVLGVVVGVEAVLGWLWHVNNMAGLFRPTGEYAMCSAATCGPVVSEILISMAVLMLIGAFFVMIPRAPALAWDTECGVD